MRYTSQDERDHQRWLSRRALARTLPSAPASQEMAERRLVALLREQEARQRRTELMDRFGNDDE